MRSAQTTFSIIHRNRAVLFMVAAALAIRLVVIPFTFGEWKNPRVIAQYEPGNVAIALLHGHGIGSPWSTGVDQPSAVMSPVYPLLLAAIYRVFGINSETSIKLALGLNCLVSALACIPVFLISRRSFGQPVAAFAGWAWAFSPFGIYFAAEWPWPTHLLLLCICWLVYLAQRMESSSRATLWVFFGVLAGFAVLTEPSAAPLVPFLACICAWRLASAGRRWCLPLLLSGIAVIGTVSPWMVRNAMVFHRFIPMRSGLGLELYIGNYSEGNHWTSMDHHPNHNAAELAEYRAGEMAYMDHKMRQSIEQIREHKLWYAVRCVRRAGYLWTGFWSFDPAYLAEEPMDLANIPLCTLLTLLAAIGLVVTWKENPCEAVRVGGVLFLYPLIYYFVHPEAYRMRPLDPYIGMLGCVAVHHLVVTVRFALARRSSADRRPVEA